MRDYPTWQIVLLALFDLCVIAYLYVQVKKEEPIEIPEYARHSLKVVRYDRRDLRDYDDSECDDLHTLPPAA